MQPNRDAWLDRMPDLLAMAAARWGLRIAGPLEGGSLSCVHACTDADELQEWVRSHAARVIPGG